MQPERRRSKRRSINWGCQRFATCTGFCHRHWERHAESHSAHLPTTLLKNRFCRFESGGTGQTPGFVTKVKTISQPQRLFHGTTCPCGCRHYLHWCDGT